MKLEDFGVDLKVPSLTIMVIGQVVKENGYKKIGDAYTSTCKTINDGFNG